MTRRIVRTVFQLSGLLLIVLILVVFLDEHYRVLPAAIHNHLPVHHDGYVVTDLTVKTCSSLNPLSSCRMDPEQWHRVEKDLYLNTGWVSAAYLHVKRKREEELKSDDRVVIDVKVGRLDPSLGEKDQGDRKWESRPSGIWIERSGNRHDVDSNEAVTAVDVLFGPDAVEPRLGWKLRAIPLLLDKSGGLMEAHVSIRKGSSHKSEKAVPRIRKDGKFKIMQVADLHLSTGLGECREPEPKDHNGGECAADSRTLDFIAKMLEDERPDLVVLTGDQVNGDTAPDAQSAIFKFADMFSRRNIPYAAIFGNHDDEGSSLTRASMMSLMESLPNSLSEAGPDTVEGVGNYVVEVLAHGSSHHSALSLYLLDTHSYSPDERNFKGYDWIKSNQIKWFKEKAAELKRAHQSYTKIHMDMAFIHIPLPEYRKTDNKIVGEWKEPVTAPGFNSGFRDALVDAKVLAVSCGHDHVNDFCSLDKSTDGRADLWMCYGGGAGFGGYGGYGGYHRRVRFFDVDTNSARITTYKRVEYGNTEKRLDEQTIVESGRVVG